jgi:hypothetical protein
MNSLEVFPNHFLGGKLGTLRGFEADFATVSANVRMLLYLSLK